LESIRFRGWIPAVSGRLSFTVFGDTAHPTPAESANVADAKGRYLVSYQNRDAGDALTPRLFKLEGDLWFVLIARTKDSSTFTQHYLCGPAFIFRDGQIWKDHVLPHIQEMQELLRNYREHVNGDLNVYAGSAFESLVSICRRLSSFYGYISASRTGTTDIEIPWPQSGSPEAPILPDTGPKREHILHKLSAQLFFFIKDLGHRHQHHNPFTDTIVDLHRSDEEDIQWRLATLYAIYRKIIQYKRNPHIATFSHCIGLVAYARTFNLICEEELGSDKENLLPVYYSSEMVDSIKSTQARIERQFSVIQRQSDTIRNMVISITSLFIGFAGLIKLSNYQPDIEPSWIFGAVLRLLLAYPIGCFVVLSVVIYSVVIITSRKYVESGSLKLKVFLLLQVLRRWVSVTILLGVAAMAFAIFGFLLAKL